MVCFGVETQSRHTQNQSSKLYLARMVNAAHLSTRCIRPFVSAPISSLLSFAKEQSCPSCSSSRKNPDQHRISDGHLQVPSTMTFPFPGVEEAHVFSVQNEMRKQVTVRVGMSPPLSHFHFSIKAPAKSIKRLAPLARSWTWEWSCVLLPLSGIQGFARLLEYGICSLNTC